MAYIRTFENLETTPWILALGAVANSPGVDALAASMQSQPGVECAFFEIGPLAPFANAYWYKQLGADTLIDRYEYSASFMFPTEADSNACQCLEMDFQQVVTKIFNPALQLDFADGKIRNWDRLKGDNKDPNAWSAIADLARWQPNTWHTASLQARRLGDMVYYEAISVDDLTVWAGTIAHPATIPAVAVPMLNVAIQLDGNGAKTQYRVMVDRVKMVGRGL